MGPKINLRRDYNGCKSVALARAGLARAASQSVSWCARNQMLCCVPKSLADGDPFHDEAPSYDEAPFHDEALFHDETPNKTPISICKTWVELYSEEGEPVNSSSSIVSQYRYFLIIGLLNYIICVRIL